MRFNNALVLFLNEHAHLVDAWCTSQMHILQMHKHVHLKSVCLDSDMHVSKAKSDEKLKTAHFCSGRFETYQQCSFICYHLVVFCLETDYKHFITLLTCALGICAFETCTFDYLV